MVMFAHARPPAFSTLAVGATMTILVLFPCSFAAVQPEPHADELASHEALLSAPSNLVREDVLETQRRTHTSMQRRGVLRRHPEDLLVDIQKCWLGWRLQCLIIGFEPGAIYKVEIVIYTLQDGLVLDTRQRFVRLPHGEISYLLAVDLPRWLRCMGDHYDWLEVDVLVFDDFPGLQPDEVLLAANHGIELHYANHHAVMSGLDQRQAAMMCDGYGEEHGNFFDAEQYARSVRPWDPSSLSSAQMKDASTDEVLQNQARMIRWTSFLVVEALSFSLYVDDPSQDQMCGISSWPAHGLSMAGKGALWNLVSCMQNVISEGVPGVFVETGIWRGASGILARILLDAYGDDREVYNLDSFEWLPAPNPAFSQDRRDVHNAQTSWCPGLKNGASLEEVKRTYLRFGIDTEDPSRHTHLIKGYFEVTVPPLARKFQQDQTSISVLRLDGDMYQSTWEVLVYLYEFVSIGGYIIVDDWELPGCRSAIDDFRRCVNSTEPFTFFEAGKTFWRKEAHVDKRVSSCYWNNFTVS